MKIKFYAVKAGRRTGIYPTWPECEAQTKGYPGAVYKGFSNRGDAEKFLGGPKPKWAKSKPGQKKPFKYARIPKTGRRTHSIFTELYSGDVPPWDESLGEFACLNVLDQVKLDVWQALGGN